MKVAIISGKGGTGKTFLATGLAYVRNDVVYADLDVEEPNGKLFLKPENLKEKKVTVKQPSFDTKLCIGCRECVSICAFHALAFIKERPVLFPEVCHSCGGCSLVCQHNAVKEIEKEVGHIQIGTMGTKLFYEGEMNIGEMSGVPVIEAVIQELPDQTDCILDCPPGSGCSVLKAVSKADLCIIVVEPTAYGIHNFKMVYELTRQLKKSSMVVINKCLEGENPAKDYCDANQIPVLACIPYNQDIGRKNGNGQITIKEHKELETLLQEVWRQVKENDPS